MSHLSFPRQLIPLFRAGVSEIKTEGTNLSAEYVQQTSEQYGAVDAFRRLAQRICFRQEIANGTKCHGHRVTRMRTSTTLCPPMTNVSN